MGRPHLSPLVAELHGEVLAGLDRALGRGTAILLARVGDGERELVAQYRRRVVIIDATDQPIVHAQSLLTLEVLKKIGVNAEIQAGDWGTLITRRTVKDPPEKGGWNIFHTWLVGPDVSELTSSSEAVENTSGP